MKKFLVLLMAFALAFAVAPTPASARTRSHGHRHHHHRSRSTNHPLHPCGYPRSGSPSPSVDAAMRSAAGEFHVSYALMHDIAAGESNFNPGAKNPHSSAAGLFQHLGRYWPSRVDSFNRANPNARLGSSSIYDPTAASRVTAWMISRGQASAWRC